MVKTVQSQLGAFLTLPGLADDHQHPSSAGNSDEVGLKANPTRPSLSSLPVVRRASPERLSGPPLRWRENGEPTGEARPNEDLGLRINQWQHLYQSFSLYIYI